MRNLQLSHEQIELIQQALGIAEKKFLEINKTIVEDTILVRDVNKTTEKAKEQNAYFLISTKFAELNLDIDNSKFDI